jgi:hypothetical protein
MGEINVIFGGGMSIASKTQGKKSGVGDQLGSAHRAGKDDEVF